MSSTLSRLVSTGAAMLLVASLAACQRQPSLGGASVGSAAATAIPPAKACAQIAAVPSSPTAPTTALVVDRSASGEQGPLPPVVAVQLAKAQAAGSTVTLIGVPGADRRPVILAPIGLDPMPGVASTDADEIRVAALGCVARWAQDPRLEPTSEGSDVLAALAAAARQAPRAIIVVSDGVSTEGALDLRRIGWDADPAGTAADLRAQLQLPTLPMPVIWSDLGETVSVLPEAARQNLAALWSAVLVAAGSPKPQFPSVVTGSGIASAAPRAGLPADPIPTVAIVPPPMGCVQVPDGLLFAPNRATVSDPRVLMPVVDQLRAHPTWSVRVEGHTADYGTAAGRLKLSQQRAQQVVAALRLDGLPGTVRVTASGYGATRPVATEWSHGVHDAAAAARNRRVEITYGPTLPPAGAHCH